MMRSLWFSQTEPHLKTRTWKSVVRKNDQTATVQRRSAFALLVGTAEHRKVLKWPCLVLEKLPEVHSNWRASSSPSFGSGERNTYAACSAFKCVWHPGQDTY